jgi:hypothetical protein
MYNIQSYEKLQRDIKPACNALNAKLNRPEIEQTFAILDMKGVNLSFFGSKIKGFVKKQS